MKSPIELLFSLLVDFRRLNGDVKGLERDLITLERRYEDEGYGFLTVALPSLCDSLLQGLTTGRFCCPAGFKTIRGGTIPRLFSGMFSEVFEPSTGLLLESPNQGVLTDLYQILRLMKKTQLSPKSEELLHKKAVDEFYQCDETASRVIIPNRQDRHLGLVCKLILPTLETKDEKDGLYRHGPGAVDEGYRANQKWGALFKAVSDGDSCVPDWSPLHEFYQLKGGFRHGDYLLREYAVGTPTPPSDKLEGVAYQLSQVSNSHWAGSPSRTAIGSRAAGVSRLVTVAKNSTSRRTITVEPLVNQYHQQGLNQILRDSIKECQVLRQCLDLTHQEHNQKLALEGSLTGDWATIDLKSASDLLSVSLVKAVFRHHPNFLGMMMDCRSPMVKSDGKSPSPLGKFAGQGNALTFPVQSICFATVCIAAILDMRGVSPTMRKVREASALVRVYGDDIIVHADYARHCVTWLQDLGLRVNVKKSFLEGHFRESCGVDAFKGIDITPLYLRCRPEDIGESPSNCASLVSLSNHLWLKGLYAASNCLKEHVESYIGKALPLVSRESGALGWHSRQDAMTPHKWCRRTHQLLSRAFVLAPVKRRDRLDGYGALLKSLLTPLLGRDIDHLDSTTIRFKNRFARRWVPVRVAQVKVH